MLLCHILKLAVWLLHSALCISFNLDPVRQRDTKSNQPIHQQLCLQYELQSKMTLLTIESKGSIKNHVFQLEITDDRESLIRRQIDIKDKRHEVVFKPEPNKVINVCLLNMVKDASWVKKGHVRQVTLNVAPVYDHENPKYDRKEIKELREMMNKNARVLIENVEIVLSNLDEEMKHLVRRESKLRDLNENTLVLMNWQLVVFFVAVISTQVYAFYCLRTIAKF